MRGRVHDHARVMHVRRCGLSLSRLVERQLGERYGGDGRRCRCEQLAPRHLGFSHS
jgi:hypothetical protein